MYALIAMLLALGVLVVLVRLKVKLGLSMVLSSLALAILLGVRPGELWAVVVEEWNSKPLSRTTGYMFVTLVALVTLVNVLGVAMKETGVSHRLAGALQGIFRSRRLALAAIPMMMGLLPTPGGIMLSAPMVRQLGDDIGIDRDRSAAVNFLFRHQWETIWPLFPAVLWVRGMLGVSAFELILHNLPIMVSGTLGGVMFLLVGGIRPAENRRARARGRLLQDLRDFAHAFWPIVLVGLLYVLLGVVPAVGLVPATVVFLVVQRVPVGNWAGTLRSAFRFDLVLLIFGVLLFKVNLEAGRAVQSVVQFFWDMHVPKTLLIFLLPMLVSFLTGLTLATVAMTFPLLLPFMSVGEQVRLGLEVLAFSGVVCGLLLTPVHLCMALSAGYFETSVWKIVVRVAGPVVFVAAAGIVMAVLFG